ncbi:hypothetical protein [Sigmofec virus UA08Rod_5764]|uniref:Uncharacterized protein n=1 Tax=Sigmofec virus UA08Rod_5764 TaxID=2929440 RepID=A0A976R7A5_9VIRU|nr:hypothetical protein [Sigmofec virus UA08Rod_5764]
MSFEYSSRRVPNGIPGAKFYRQMLSRWGPIQSLVLNGAK